jgi:type I restriction enzyme, S subunit
MAWEIFSIGNIGRIITGKTPSFQNPKEFGNFYPFITPSDMSFSIKHIDAERKLSENGKEKYSKIILPKKSTCVVCIGATIGKTCITKTESFTNQQINSIIPNNEKHDPDFIYYFSTLLRPTLESFAGGAATPIINKSSFSSIKTSLPDLKTQKKIAAILSAYDDLIENNKRRIALLENMAEEIYREWFVRFRFPGYKTAEVEKGIPKGWQLMPFSQAVDINPMERPEKDELKPYVGMEALSTNSMFFKSTERRKGNTGSKFRNGDTLFPRITPCLENGKRGFVMTLELDEVAIGSTEFIVMREKLLTSEYIYLLTCFEPFRTHAEISMVGASGRQRISENCFSFFIVAIPPKDLLDRFTEIVRPMFELIRVLSNQNNYLEMAKNNLLPRLISGKLSVENLDIQLPPSMQEGSVY